MRREVRAIERVRGGAGGREGWREGEGRDRERVCERKRLQWMDDKSTDVIKRTRMNKNNGDNEHKARLFQRRSAIESCRQQLIVSLAQMVYV